jgi:hypothetical protein
MAKRSFLRLDVSAAPDLFRRLGVAPVVGHWGGDNCACYLVAVCQDNLKPYQLTRLDSIADMAARWDNRGIRNGVAASRIARAMNLDPDYVLGIIYGWDGEPMTQHSLHSPEYTTLTTAGWADGQAARRACEARYVILPTEDRTRCNK